MEPPISEKSTEFVSISWNLEGFQSNINNLVHFVQLHKPSFIFISESQIFQHDMLLAAQPLQHQYSWFLNSEDYHDQDVSLFSQKAFGGTLILWKREHDPFVKVQSPCSSSFLLLEFSPPGLPPTLHVCVYLPTAGKDGLFVDNLAQLTLAIEEFRKNNPDHICYFRGDFNVSKKNQKRTSLLQQFCSDFDLKEVEIQHPTYHHFMGSGESDSHLDRFLYSDYSKFSESLVKIHCKLENPLVSSHHDLIVTVFALPHVPLLPESSTNNITAPVVNNTRIRIKWSESGIKKYQNLVPAQLARTWEMWSDPTSKSSLSVLLQSTNSILNTAASLTNRKIDLGASPKQQQPVIISKKVQQSQRTLLKHHRSLQAAARTMSADEIFNLKNDYNKARSEHRRLERKIKARMKYKRDQHLFSILESNGTTYHRTVKTSRRSSAGNVQKLQVRDKTYLGDSVQDGFFDSISFLKSINQDSISSSHSFQNFSEDYANIIEICSHGEELPPISIEKATDILHSIKPAVADLYSITAHHYINAGESGIVHFYKLLNLLIHDINSISIPELNAVYAIILFKGHNKERNSARSYRTISTCPFLAKVLDLYVRDLNLKAWNSDQADTQFQGEGSSHELASLLLTECVQHSLHTLKNPCLLYI